MSNRNRKNLKLVYDKEGHRHYINQCEVSIYLEQGYTLQNPNKKKNKIELLAESIPLEDIIFYYENQNHTAKESACYFNITEAQFKSLIRYYNYRKPAEQKTANSLKGKLLKYGDAHYNNRSKAIQTCQEKYKVNSPLQLPRVREIIESHETRMKAQNKFKSRTGKKVWNEGEKGLQHWVEGQAARRSDTLRKNHTFNTSKPEEVLYLELIEKYGEVRRNYNGDVRYPWHCDFYIPSEDLFIELNRFPTHYIEPFDESNPDHIKLLEHCKKEPCNWIEKEMVNIWAGTDVQKLKKARENKLNYLVIY